MSTVTPSIPPDVDVDLAPMPPHSFCDFVKIL